MPNQHCVLIVDDELDLLSIYKTKLQQAGYEVLTATSGKEAIEIAAAKRPQLILMDEKMPIMSGVVAGRALQENPATKDIPVIFLTAFSGPASVQEDLAYLKKSGAPYFIKKGTSLDELVEKIREHLKLPKI